MSRKNLSLIGAALVVVLLFVISSNSSNLKNLFKNSGQGSAIASKINAEALVLQTARTNELNAHKTLIKKQNKDVRQALDLYRNGPADKKLSAKKDLEENLKLRKKIILEQIKKDPEAVLATAFSKEEFEGIPSDLQPLVEIEKSISAPIGIYHEDNFSPNSKLDPKASSFHYVLLGQPKGLVELYIPGREKNEAISGLTTGQNVKVKGVFIDNQMALWPDNISVTVLGESTDSEGNVLGLSSGPLNAGSVLTNHNVLVIMANFQDGTQYTNADRTTLSNTMFGAGNQSVAGFYSESSYGAMTLTGTVVGPFLINYSHSDIYSSTNNPSGTLYCGTAGQVVINSITRDTIGKAAFDAAIAQGVSTAGYNNVVVVAPNTGCSAGLGYVGLPMTLIPAVTPGVLINSYLHSTEVYAHELGHNFGYQHAHAPTGCDLDTYGKQNCSMPFSFEGEYGDKYSVMGVPLMGNSELSTFTPHFNAWEKDISGWINYGSAPTITNVTSSGTYTINKFESGGGTKALTYTSPNNTGVKYYLEYRTGEGRDTGYISGTPIVVNGVLVHSARNTNQGFDPDPRFKINGGTVGNKYYIRDGSMLIDTHPNVSSPSNMTDAALHVGDTFTDPFSATTFTVTSETPTSATVSVSVDQGCSRVPSVSVANPYQNGTIGQIDFPNTITVTNNDTAGCPNDTVFNVTPMAGSGISNGVQYFSVPSAFALVLDPGETSAPISIPSTFLGVAPSVPIDMGMWVENLNKPGIFNTVKYQLFETNDITPPTITNVNYWNLASNSVTIQWNTFDDVSTSQVFYGTNINNLNLYTTVDPFDFVVSHAVTLTGLAPNTMYYYKVKSVNPAGLSSETVPSVNMSFTTLSGSVDNTNPVVSLTSPQNGANLSGTVAVNGTATDANGIANVTLYDGTNPIGAMTSIGGSSYTYSLNTTNLSNGAHTLSMKATDPSTNIGTSNSVSVTVNNDATAPVISSISATGVTSSGATISWLTTGEASTTVVDYGTTNAYGSTATVAGLSTTHSVNLASLLPSTTYHYRVKSADSSGNLATSTDQTFTTLAGTAPSVTIATPTYNGTNATVVSGTVVLTSTVTGVGISSVKYFKSNSNVLIGTGTIAPNYTYNWDTTLKPDNTFNVVARGYASDGVTLLASSPVIKVKVLNGTIYQCSDAIDNDGDGLIDFPQDTGCTSLTDNSEVNTDTTAPTVPSNLVATSITSSTVSLSWSASTDNVGVVGYQIFKNGVFLGTTTGTTFTATSLVAGTTYSFSVKAYDAVPNYSSASTSLSVTTNPSSPNNAPIVSAGGSSNTVSKNIPGVYMYNASVTDSDGPAPLTILWTKISGPGTVTWTNSASPQSQVSFSLAGTYVMRLTATDGAGASAYSETTWTVTN